MGCGNRSKYGFSYVGYIPPRAAWRYAWASIVELWHHANLNPTPSKRAWWERVRKKEHAQLYDEGGPPPACTTATLPVSRQLARTTSWAAYSIDKGRRSTAVAHPRLAVRLLRQCRAVVAEDTPCRRTQTHRETQRSSAVAKLARAQCSRYF